jgi:hypothetical protein
MEQFRAMIEPFCRQPIIGLCYLFARGSILDWALHGLAGGIATPVPGVPDVITDKIKDVVTDQVREGHQERSGGRSQALCAITESQVVVVGVAPAAAAFGLAPDYNRLTVCTPPLVFDRATTGVEVSKRLLTRRLTFTDHATKRHYEFEVHTAGKGDFNNQFFDALASYLPK